MQRSGLCMQRGEPGAARALGRLALTDRPWKAAGWRRRVSHRVSSASGNNTFGFHADCIVRTQFCSAEAAARIPTTSQYAAAHFTTLMHIPSACLITEALFLVGTSYFRSQSALHHVTLYSACSAENFSCTVAQYLPSRRAPHAEFLPRPHRFCLPDNSLPERLRFSPLRGGRASRGARDGSLLLFRATACLGRRLCNREPEAESAMLPLSRCFFLRLTTRNDEALGRSSAPGTDASPLSPALVSAGQSPPLPSIYMMIQTKTSSFPN